MLLLIISSVLSLPFFVGAVRYGYIAYKKNDAGRQIGLPEARDKKNYETSTKLIIPVAVMMTITISSLLLQFVSNVLVDNATENLKFWIALSKLGYLSAFIIVLLYAVYSICWYFENKDEISLAFKKVKEPENLETFFGDLEYSPFRYSGLGYELFEKYFNFSPVKKDYKNAVLLTKNGKERDAIIQVAKVFQELMALKRLQSTLPSESRMSPSDLEKKKQLKKLIETKAFFLKEAKDIVKAAVKTENDVYYSRDEKESVETLRNLSFDLEEPTFFIHPTIEELIKIQTDPGVSQDKKDEAKELEQQVRTMIKPKQKFSMDELVDARLRAVKMFHGIQ